MVLRPYARRAGLSRPLALAWAALIVYASLFPFSGWRWPPGASALDLLRLPWPRWFGGFDMIANFAGYMPLGLLAALAHTHGATGRHGRLGLQAAAFACALSYGMEVTQQLLPQRVPSGLDWALNSAGAGIGAALAVAARRVGLDHRFGAARERWLHASGTSGPALLLLWPAGLLFPTPLPLGLGQVWGRISERLSDALVDVDVAGVQALVAWLDDPPRSVMITAPYTTLVVALGLLAPCLLAFAMMNPGLRRLLAAGVLGTAGVAATMLSTALGVGPQHALAWLTPGSVAGMAAGVALAVVLAWIGPRTAAALGLVALSGLVTLVSLAPSDPYFIASLKEWEQGRFIRFNGISQWIGWLWPYAAMTWLLGRLSTRE